MASSNRQAVTLEDDDLNDWDRHILDYLHDGRATPGLVRKMLIRDGVTDSITRQYINGRMTRLEEHDHLTNILDSGVYELANDPRDSFVPTTFHCDRCDVDLDGADELVKHARKEHPETFEGGIPIADFFNVVEEE